MGSFSLMSGLVCGGTIQSCRGGGVSSGQVVLCMLSHRSFKL